MTTTAGDAMSWTEALENPKSLTALYVNPPRVVELLRVSLDRDGSRVDLIGRLDEFPDQPPNKWTAAGSNVAVMTLRLEGLAEFQVASWTTSNDGLLTVVKDPSGLAFSFTASDRVIVSGKAAVAHVVGFSHHFDPVLAKKE